MRTLLIVLFTAALAHADEPITNRPAKLKTLNDYFPFDPPKTKEAWEKRRDEVKQQLRVATGLWPMPEKTPLHPTIHGKIERDGYTIEDVSFESRPGHYVTGNLYRPTDGKEKHPAVLAPHGHLKDGRFYEATPSRIKDDLETRAESFELAARYPYQSLCANLAMMGCVVFHYDMVGIADSTALIHREGFLDAKAQLNLQSKMGLQTWNSIRCVDFVSCLPDVDPTKIGVTGSSGGGTQTMILAALDDRITAAFPAVMVSTSMQGGCVCENCSYLRIDTGNIEFAALFAPKPMAMSGADDWTKEIETKGYPQLQQVWSLYGKKENVKAKAWPQYPHNYNQPAREFMYTWFNKHLLGNDEVVHEKEFVPVPPSELSVYDAEHPRPKDELGAEALRKKMKEESAAQLTAMSEKERQVVVREALKVLVGQVPTEIVPLGKPELVEFANGYGMFKIKFRRNESNDVIQSTCVFGPKSKNKSLIWVDPNGGNSIQEKGAITMNALRFVDAGYSIIAVELPNPIPVNDVYPGFTFGYNYPTPAKLARQIQTAIGIPQLLGGQGNIQIDIIGFGQAGPVALLAAATAGDAIDHAVIDMNQFRFADIDATNDPMLLPGMVKYGDVEMLLSLCQAKMLVHNRKGGKKKSDNDVIDWLLKPN